MKEEEILMMLMMSSSLLTFLMLLTSKIIFSTEPLIPIMSSDVIGENWNKYQGHAITVNENTNYRAVLVQLFRELAMAQASHNLWAMITGSYIMQDDDGLHSVSHRKIETLQQHSVSDCMSVVTVWKKENTTNCPRECFNCIDRATKDAVFARN